MKQYIAALDYEHLDNGVFLTSLAASISQQQQVRSIIVHADSAYTERVMQTGVMREEAKVRSIKDLNHRLIALFADQGVSAIGINGYQRKFITLRDGGLHLDRSFYQGLPRQSVLLISCLVWNASTSSPVAISLAQMASFLRSSLEADAVFGFLKNDKSELFTLGNSATMQWDNLPSGFVDSNLPEELRAFNKPLQLTTARDFHHPFNSKKTILIR